MNIFLKKKVMFISDPFEKFIIKINNEKYYFVSFIHIFIFIFLIILFAATVQKA